MWRNIQNIIRFGFAHNNQNMGPGSLAMFCPTCPQPGINLPENWEEDPEQSVPIFALPIFSLLLCAHQLNDLSGRSLREGLSLMETSLQSN
jgi:hypothetical protein